MIDLEKMLQPDGENKKDEFILTPSLALNLLDGDAKIIIVANYDEETNGFSADMNVGFTPERTPKDVEEFMKLTLKSILAQLDEHELEER
jgi:hypothetical protein